MGWDRLVQIQRYLCSQSSYDIFEKEDPTFDTDDVLKDDDYEDPIFGDPSGFGQCGKRNNEGVTAKLREVNFLYGGKCKIIFRF